MTQDEIIELACQTFGGIIKKEERKNFLAFAKLVVEKEREACAKMCDDRVIAYQYANDVWAQEHIDEARHLAKAIRARGQA